MSAPERDLIDSLANGYRDAQIVLAAVRLDLFTAIGRDAIRADALAAKLGTDPRATRILCDALAALLVLRKRDDTYRNGPEALDSLVAGAPNDRRAILRHNARLYHTWGALYHVVREGGPVDVEIDDDLGGSPRDFANAMADVGRRTAKEALRALDLKNVRTMLDGGGGPGVYAIEFARQYPNLTVTLMDTAETLEVAAENVAQAGLTERIRFQAGNLLEDDLGGPYDFILLSNLVHCLDNDTNRALVARCAAALSDTGRICIKDFVLNEDHITPPGAAIFAVNMLVNTQAGDCYSVDQINGWFKAAGLKPQTARQVGAMSRMLIASK